MSMNQMDLRKPSPSNRVVFIDLETAGLEPERGAVLEVGCIIVDRELKEIARSSWAVAVDVVTLRTLMPRDVAKVHEASGLLREVLRSRVTVEIVDSELALFIRQHEAQGGLLGVRNATFERSWMRHYLPESLRTLHYRSLDVSALTECMRLAAWDVDSRLEPTRRALADCDYALAQARFVLDKAIVKPSEELQAEYRKLITELGERKLAAPPVAERKPEQLQTETKVEVIDAPSTTKVKVLGREVVPPSRGRGQTKVLEEVPAEETTVKFEPVPPEAQSALAGKEDASDETT